MSKQREREEFIAKITAEGVSVDVAQLLLRHSATLQRIAELECSSETADRDRVPCPATQSEKERKNMIDTGGCPWIGDL